MSFDAGLIHTHSLYLKVSQRDVVYLRWPIAHSNMRDRLEGKIQNAGGVGNRVHTEWQLPLSGGHSIMMEKFAQPGEVGGAPLHAHPLSLYLPSHTYKVVVYAPARRADTLTPFLLYPYMYSVVRAIIGCVVELCAWSPSKPWWSNSIYLIYACTLYQTSALVSENDHISKQSYERLWWTQSTDIYRAPQCMSPRWNWDSPSVPSPPDQRVGGHTRLRLKGWGSPNSNDWRNAWHSAYSVMMDN